MRVLVALEPPYTRLLDDAADHIAFGREVYDTYRSDGADPAMGKFLARAGLDQGGPQPPVDPTPEMAAAMAQMGRNMDFFLAHMWLALGEYQADLTQRRSRPIVVAVGEGQRAGSPTAPPWRWPSGWGRSPSASPATTAGSVNNLRPSQVGCTRCSAPIVDPRHATCQSQGVTASGVHDLYQRWLDELWNGSPSAAQELVSDDFVGHRPDRDVTGPAELATLVGETQAMFTDLSFAMVGPIVEDDLVSARRTGRGETPDGPMTFFGNDILRVRGGRFVECWVASSVGS